MLQINFDANRRGLAQLIQMQNDAQANGTETSTSARSGTVETASNPSNLSNPAPATASVSEQNQAASSTTSTINSILNKPSSSSMNLRVRLAKLIKDIVVHHGDNIQYVQLADQAASTSASSGSATSSGSIGSSPTMAPVASSSSLPSQSERPRSLNGDDEPLIEP
jgi:hypothetical protein